MINKGTVSTVLQDGKMVSIKPYTGESVTAPLVVPFFLFGGLPVGIEVVYATFPDGTGIVLARTDGEFNRNIPGSLTIDGSLTVAGNITASDVNTDAASFNSHIHQHPYGPTTTPQ